MGRRKGSADRKIKRRKGKGVNYMDINNDNRTFLVVQWLRLCLSTAGGRGLILGRGTKIPQAVWRGQIIIMMTTMGRFIEHLV